MSLTLEQLEFLRTPQAAGLLAEDLPADPLRAVQTLREHCPPPQAAAVLSLRALRRRAAERFPQALAAGMLATEKLLQQASSFRLAVWKGLQMVERFGRVEGEVIDLCCGLGADAIGMAQAGLKVRGIDVSATAVLCASHNAAAAGVAPRCRFEQADAMNVALPRSALLHVDPDRRAGGRRSVHLAECAPGEDFLRALPARTAGGVMKLSPACDRDEAVSLPVAELEYVSESGVCKQLLGWWAGQPVGPEGPGRRATVVFGPAEAPQSASLQAGQAPYAPIRDPGPWLIEPDPAVIAAEAVDDLAAAEGLWRIAAGLPWLFGEGPVQGPTARSFLVLETVPGRSRDVARAVRRLDGGQVEIKPRGLKLDTDRLQRTLRGRGRRRLSVLWCRLDLREQAFICERKSR